MKKYNSKIIANNNELKIAFECDKNKSKECNKKHCTESCNHTTDTKYMKAKQRNKKLTDKELIVSLENEIEYYRHEIDLLKNVHQENIECINKQDKIIKEYQETFKEVILNKKDIFNTKTPNQIRRLLGYDSIESKESNECLDKEFEITINNEDYLIKYNSNTNAVVLNTYLTKIVNENKTFKVCKYKEFKIINKTRFKEYGDYSYNE